MHTLWLLSNSAFNSTLFAEVEKASSSWIWVAVAAGIGAAWYVLTKWNIFRTKEGVDTSSPKGLFAELASAHKLDRVEKGLLTEAAATQGLADPALLFVDARHLKTLAGSRNEKSADYTALARKLFG